MGASFDGAATRFDGTSYVGGLSAYDRSFIGPAVVIDEPGINSPVSVAVSTASYGIHLTDTFHVTPRLAATLSGRLNAVFVDLTDQNGRLTLSGSHSYVHFNPAAGLTYRVNAWLTAYGGYAVANRAPTPAELSCAGPSNACSLANFFVGDPDLKQVVSGTFEAGLRGTFKPFEEAELHYSLALFRSDLYDDIAFVNSPTQGRAFFANIGQTRRQGLDAELQLKTGRWLAYVSYSYIDATYQSGFVEASGANPAADANSSITVHPGDTSPGHSRASGQARRLLQRHGQMDGGRDSHLHQRGVSLRGRSQSHAASGPLCHSWPQHELSRPAQFRDFRLGPEHHQHAVFDLRYVFADRVSGACPEHPVPQIRAPSGYGRPARLCWQRAGDVLASVCSPAVARNIQARKLGCTGDVQMFRIGRQICRQRIKTRVTFEFCVSTQQRQGGFKCSSTSL